MANQNQSMANYTESGELTDKFRQEELRHTKYL